MVRPAAEILQSKQINDYLSIDILNAHGLYAVVYKSKPINLKQKYWNAHGLLTKYPKTVFSNQAPANNLAAKLNKEFFTEDFSVIKIL